jgi:hypothetical protein
VLGHRFAKMAQTLKSSIAVYLRKCIRKSNYWFSSARLVSDLSTGEHFWSSFCGGKTGLGIISNRACWLLALRLLREPQCGAGNTHSRNEVKDAANAGQDRRVASHRPYVH